MKTSILEEVKTTAVTEPLRVLIVEHSRLDVELILAQLKGIGTRFDATLVEDQQQFVRALRENDFGIILSDYRLPNWTGLDALRELRACGKDTPFVVITGTLGEEAAVECIKQGVSDFVLKDNLPRLPSVIKRTLNEKALRDENNRAHEALRISKRATANWWITPFTEFFTRRPMARFWMRIRRCSRSWAAASSKIFTRSTSCETFTGSRSNFFSMWRTAVRVDSYTARKPSGVGATAALLRFACISAIFPIQAKPTRWNSSPKTLRSSARWSGSCARRRNLKPSASSRAAWRTISTTSSVRSWDGRSWAWTKTRAEQRPARDLRASRNRRSGPRRSRANCWLFRGARSCSDRPLTSTPLPAD